MMSRKLGMISLFIMLVLIVVLGLVYTFTRPHIEDFEMFDKIKNGLAKANKKQAIASEEEHTNSESMD